MTEETKTYYDDFSGWYENERHHGYHAMIDELELDVLRPLAKDRKALDVGCGTGLIMQGLNGVASGITGVDLSQGMLGLAKKRGFQVAQGVAGNLPFADESFDLVYSFKVLAHVPEIREALAEMSRVLKPGGYLVAEFYNAHSLRRLAKWIGGPGRISKDRTEADVYTRWDTAKQVLKYFPDQLVWQAWRGVRVFTPAAAVFKLPYVNKILPVAERMAVNSPLCRFAGFLISVYRKRQPISW
jgi:ubiquinone/menaquinone biosynthesis C-methylase UbiE